MIALGFSEHRFAVQNQIPLIGAWLQRIAQASDNFIPSNHNLQFQMHRITDDYNTVLSVRRGRDSKDSIPTCDSWKMFIVSPMSSLDQSANC